MITTAINIGFSSGLLDNDMPRFIVDGMDKSEIEQQLSTIERKMNVAVEGQKRALIIAGDSLTEIEKYE